MKKVLYVATVDLHIRTFHIPYLKLLHDNGYEVHVATNGNEQFPYCDVKHQISIERSPFKFGNLKAIRQLKKIINKEKYDIIHCHTPMGSVVARLAAKRARNNGTKVIYTCHGYHFYKNGPILNWLMFYPVEKYLAKYTDSIITINKEDYNLSIKHFKRRCKNIHYIPGIGVDIDKFNFKMCKKEMEKLSSEIGISANDFILIFPARLDKNKNQGFLIECMKKLVELKPNIHLLLPGIDELNGKYQEITKNYGLENNIHFLGHRDDIPKLLKISNIAVSSSIREGFGINLVEALASNVPIIAIKNRGHNDIVKDNENGFLVNCDVEEFVNRVILIYESKVLLKPLETVNKFSINNSINIVWNLYNGSDKND